MAPNTLINNYLGISLGENPNSSLKARLKYEGLNNPNRSSMATCKYFCFKAVKIYQVSFMNEFY